MSHVTRLSRVAVVAAFTLMFALIMKPGTIRAQEDDTPHPAHVHSGTCDNLGDVVEPLADVSFEGPPAAVGNATDGNGTDGNTTLGNVTDGNASNATEGNTTDGNATGVDTAIPAEVSMTAVPLSLDEMLASPHAINVHLSEAEIGTYIACGDIGGQRFPDGSLAIGLHELNGSGFFGIAYLTPSDSPEDGTDISVFLAQNLIGTGGTTGVGGGNATGAPTTGGNGTDGNATDGNGTAGNSTDGNATDGNGTDGNATDGNATDGNGTGGNGTGNGTDGNGTGNGTDGNGTGGNGTGNGTGGNGSDGNGSGGNGSGGNGSEGNRSDGNGSGGNGS